MTLIIERIFATFLILVGLSYIVQSLVWKDLVQELLQKKTWLMLWSLLFLPWGLMVVFAHNIWLPSWPVIITVLGWLVTLKCVLYLIFPNWSNFVNQWRNEFLESYIQSGGVVVALLGSLILFLSF